MDWECTLVHSQSIEQQNIKQHLETAGNELFTFCYIKSIASELTSRYFAYILRVLSKTSLGLCALIDSHPCLFYYRYISIKLLKSWQRAKRLVSGTDYTYDPSRRMLHTLRMCYNAFYYLDEWLVFPDSWEIKKHIL